jgi:uncharacterized membrane protein HdeD (DUF308 family)
MIDAVFRFWWAPVLRGIAAVVFGVLALAWPSLTVAVLVLLYGSYALVDGVIALSMGVFGGDQARGRRPWLVFQGALAVAAGVVTLIWPAITAIVLLWVIIAWALVGGVAQIVEAFRARGTAGGWTLGVSGVFSVAFGVIAALWPTSGALAVVFLIGINAIVSGVMAVGLGLHLRAGGESARRDSATQPAPRPTVS